MDESASTHAEAVLRELVLRLSTFPGDPRTQDPQLLVGQAPDPLPFPLALPEGSRLLGSLMRNPTTVEIVLDMPHAPEEIIDFYRDHLHALGWHEPDRLPGYEHQGFVPAGRGGTKVALYQELDGPYVQIQALPRKGPFTDVRMTVTQDNPTSRPLWKAPRRVRQRPQEGPSSLLPRLVAPVGATIQGGGSAGSLTSAQTSAMLGSDLSPSLIAAHYATQLERAGWTCTHAGSAGPTAWHTWTFRDELQEEWLGRFFLLQMPDRPQEHYLLLQIRWANSNQDDWIA